MAFDRFLIAPLNSGLERDKRPWLINDDAWSTLQNAYVFRGRIRKRFGSAYIGTGYPNTNVQPLYSRFRINLGNTDGAGAAAGLVPGVKYKVGQMFSIGTEIFTVVSAAAGAQPMLQTGATVTATYNIGTGAYNFVGAAATTPVFFYPAEPVMGLTQYPSFDIQNNVSYGFDTQFAYVFSGGAWSRSGTAIWRGTNSDFFWAYNYFGSSPNIRVMYVSNFFVVNPNGAGNASDDFIWTFDGTTWVSRSGANGFYFAPNGGAVATGPFIVTARIIVAFKNRLVLLNTIENDNSGGLGVNAQYGSRARFSWEGDPLAANAWYEPNQVDAGGNRYGGAGFEDAPTDEEIISAQFIKDRLIVFFENSTWELAFVGDVSVPFKWQKINTELGAESTFSSVPFDKAILTVGDVGIHGCSGSNVERIDQKIPDEVFEIRNRDNGVKRVAGIRDYYTELAYWTYPSDNVVNYVYPDRVLVYNYQTGSWAYNDDVITTWGYFDPQPNLTWAAATGPWSSYGGTWDSGPIQQQFRQIIAGNQEGFTFAILPDLTRNESVMSITNITITTAQNTTLIIIDHCLKANEFIYIEKAQGVTGYNGNIFKIYSVDYTNHLVNIIDPAATFAGTYTGGGVVARVSNYNLQSKQWNPYDKQGRNVYVARIDFLVDKTTDGEVLVDYFPSSTPLSMVEQGEIGGTNMLMGTNVLETKPYATVPLEAIQTRLWHPIYFQSDGECIQLYIHMTDTQMKTVNIAWADFQLHALLLHTMATSSRLQ